MKTILLLLSLNFEYQEDYRAKRLEISNSSFLLDSIRYKTLDKECVRIMWFSKNYRWTYNYEW